MKGLRIEQRSFPDHLEEKGPPRDPVMIADSFDQRTLANMELALDLACANVSGGEKHRVRRHIAARIDRCARMGHRTLSALSKAGQIAAAELRQREPAV